MRIEYGFFLYIMLFVISLPADATQFNTAADYNTALQRLFDGDDYETAYKTAKEGAALFRNNAELIGRIAWCENRLKLPGFGIATIEKAHIMNPKNALINIWREHIYLSAGWYEEDVEKAVSYWKKALGLNPANIQYYYQIGVKYTFSSTPEKAPEWYEKALNKGFTSASLYIWQGVAYQKIGNHTRAIAWIKKGIEKNKKIPDAYYYLASAYAEINNYREWAANLEIYLKLKPDDKQTRQTLAEMYVYKLNDYGASNTHYTYLIHNFSQDAAVVLWKKTLASQLPGTVILTYKYKTDDRPGPTYTLMLPIDNNYQHHLSHSFSPKPKTIAIDIDTDGNTRAHLTYTDAVPAVTAVISMQITPLSVYTGGIFDKQIDATFPHNYIGTYVDDGVTIDPGDPALKEEARTIIGKETNILKQAELIQNRLYTTFTYEVITYNTIEQYLHNKKGECGGYALVFCALARAAGIPARRIFAPLIEFNDTPLASHAISAFHHPDYGWVPVDNTGNATGTINHLIFFWWYGAKGDIIYPESYTLQRKM